MVASFTEFVVEQAALGWLEAIRWLIAHSPDIAPDMPAAGRRHYGEVMLAQRLRDALLRKLISGGLLVQDAEKFIARAV